MKQTIPIVLLGIVTAVGLGVFGTSQLFADEDKATALIANSALTGHLTLTAYDENGNIKTYRQTDNIVLNMGDNCIADLLFAEASGVCATEAANGFNFIHIGTGSNATTPKETWINPLPITCGTGNAAPDTVDSVAMTAAAGTGGTAALLTSTFTDVGANINEAAIKDSGTCGSGSPLAYQQFTAIALGALDDLTVQWTVNVDGN